MANEVIEDLKICRRSSLCLKVDFEKAYDSFRWDFLYDMLHKMGFHSKWVMWMQGCMESATVSVLVNGSPTDEFKPTRGLRQGDSLARFLFIVEGSKMSGCRHLRVQEPPKIRLGRRVENKSHTTLSPIWYSFFTQKFNFNL